MAKKAVPQAAPAPAPEQAPSALVMDVRIYSINTSGNILANASVTLGGCFAVRRVGRRSLLVGLGVGAVLFLLLLTAGLIANQGTSIANGGAGILCACLCGGAIPGLFGRKPKKKRRR